MKDRLLLLVHLLTIIAKLLGPGGAKAVVADSLLLKQQLLIINRSRRRSPNLLAHDRFLLGLWSLFLTPHRILRAAIIIRPSTPLNFHKALVRRKYHLLFSSNHRGKSGPKGPSGELIEAIVAVCLNCLWQLELAIRHGHPLFHPNIRPIPVGLGCF